MGCQVDFTSDSSLVCKKMGGRGEGGRWGSKGMCFIVYVRNHV